MKSAIQSYNKGYLSTNELVVLTAVQSRANANGGVLMASTTEISETLNNSLSRHAIARALRSLQKAGWLMWETDRPSTIYVN